jgi:shikimate kinase
MVIFLIGFMGSGKTFWAEKLSSRLNLPWFDLDRLVEEQEGAPVSQIFADKGEAYFRQAEHDLLRAFSTSFRQGETAQAILACGGGTPCFHENMELMNHAGTTIWLNPPPRILATRLNKDSGQRPLLAGKKGEELEKFISFKLDERKPFYEKAAIVIHDPVPSLQGILNAITHE